MDGVTYDYTYLGNKLVRQSWGGNTIDFAYDDQGRPYSLNYNGNVFYYILNLQGDIVRIVNSAGVVRAEYTYNAWGELLSASGPVCNLNPLRYRGYVYDDETGLYYLNSRYYDPANRRMLSPDDLSVLNASPTSLNDKNLYTYCDNNPVSRKDDDGQFWIEAGIGFAVGACWGGITAAMTGDDILTGVISNGLAGAVAGGFSSLSSIHYLVKGAITGVANATAYWLSTNKETRSIGVAAVAFSTGFVGGSWAAYATPPGANNLVNTVVTYVSTGPSSILTGIAHAVQRNRPQNRSVISQRRSATVVKPGRKVSPRIQRFPKSIVA